MLPPLDVGRAVLECQMSLTRDYKMIQELLLFWTTQIVRCKVRLRSHHFVDVCLQTVDGEKNFRHVLEWEKLQLPQASKINRQILVSASIKERFGFVRLLMEFGYQIKVDFPTTHIGVLNWL